MRTRSERQEPAITAHVHCGPIPAFRYGSYDVENTSSPAATPIASPTPMITLTLVCRNLYSASISVLSIACMPCLHAYMHDGTRTTYSGVCTFLTLFNRQRHIGEGIHQVRQGPYNKLPEQVHIYIRLVVITCTNPIISGSLRNFLTVTSLRTLLATVPKQIRIFFNTRQCKALDVHYG